ncbi:MAG: YHYH protein [bacterium]|nr:YHYH protein [bacterium]
MKMILSLFNRLLLLGSAFALLFLASCSDDEGGGDDNNSTEYEITIEGMSTSNESDMGAGFRIVIAPSNSTGSDITVSYELSGTATAGMDYQNPSGTATLSNGASEVEVAIPFIDDSSDEGDETIIITLVSTGLPTDVMLGSSNILTITISDDDSGSGTCANDNSINQDNHECDLSPTVANTYSESVSGDTRTVQSNGIPEHDYRIQIPDQVNELNSMNRTWEMDATPNLGSSTTDITNDGQPVWRFGVAKNGVPIDPAPAQPFIFENTMTGEYNFDWVFEPNWNMEAVGLDCAVAHVQPDGTYHYHGDMAIFADQLLSGLGSGTTTPSEPVQIGWAADGFPILYKYGPGSNGTITELMPSYQLKSGERPGDGVSEPCGEYTGKYTNDFEYVSGLGDLDECNGIERSITIGGDTFSYFYVITSDFPIISRCISGPPNQSFRLGN